MLSTPLDLDDQAKLQWTIELVCPRQFCVGGSAARSKVFRYWLWSTTSGSPPQDPYGGIGALARPIQQRHSHYTTLGMAWQALARWQRDSADGRWVQWLLMFETMLGLWPECPWYETHRKAARSYTSKYCLKISTRQVSLRLTNMIRSSNIWFSDHFTHVHDIGVDRY